MITKQFKKEVRQNKMVDITTDLVVVGGGMTGTCAAIAAARDGLKVTLVQDRPVLGGNASSEVRLWVLGATSHLGNNNRWAREGGIINEILLENLYRNPEGNPIIFDTLLLEKVKNEENITLLLNTAAFEVSKSTPATISGIKAFCSQNSTAYNIIPRFVIDASGDGIVSFLAGAAFRMGAEIKDEFGEGFAPDHISYGELLGHTIYFNTKDAGQKVNFTAPEFALKDITKIPKYKMIKSSDDGCAYWWIEFGGRGDTVHDTEEIKWQLWEVVYGIWDHVKNSGEYPEADNLTLEWVGHVPGKRESRRFEGKYMIRQQDVVEQTQFDDAIAYGGWAMDLHPSDGVYSKLPSCTQYHSKGIYQIPLRCYMSDNFDNLFFAGRTISATHVAFGSTRVMATSAHGGQALGYAVSQCIKEEINVHGLLEGMQIKQLQHTLNFNGQNLPNINIDQSKNLLSKATINSSTQLNLEDLPHSGSWLKLENSAAQMLPLSKNTNYSYSVKLKSTTDTELTVQLRISSKLGNYTPDQTIEEKSLSVKKGTQNISFNFESKLAEDQYAFITFIENSAVSIGESDHRITGILSVFNIQNKAVNNLGKQVPPEGSGLESFEFWIPKRRPQGANFAMNISPALEVSKTDNLKNGWTRPSTSTNAWIAPVSAKGSAIEIKWKEKQHIKGVRIFLDPDYDHPMESVFMNHPEHEIPFCSTDIRLKDENGDMLLDLHNNRETICDFIAKEPLNTTQLTLEVSNTHAHAPASVFQIEVY